MIDVNPMRCMRASEEMLRIQTTLRYEAEEIENVISALNRTDEDSLHIAAARLSGYLRELLTETRAAGVMGDMLSKIGETYLRTEMGAEEYMDEVVHIKPIEYVPIILGDMTLKTREIFEEF